jgi:hypothetical protein
VADRTLCRPNRKLQGWGASMAKAGTWLRAEVAELKPMRVSGLFSICSDPFPARSNVANLSGSLPRSP